VYKKAANVRGFNAAYFLLACGVWLLGYGKKDLSAGVKAILEQSQADKLLPKYIDNNYLPDAELY